MNEISKIDEALKMIAIVAITLWAANKGYEAGKAAERRRNNDRKINN